MKGLATFQPTEWQRPMFDTELTGLRSSATLIADAGAPGICSQPLCRRLVGALLGCNPPHLANGDYDRQLVGQALLDRLKPTRPVKSWAVQMRRLVLGWKLDNKKNKPQS